jgi:hypothetical protein
MIGKMYAFMCHLENIKKWVKNEKIKNYYIYIYIYIYIYTLDEKHFQMLDFVNVTIDIL